MNRCRIVAHVLSWSFVEYWYQPAAGPDSRITRIVTRYRWRRWP